MKKLLLLLTSVMLLATSCSSDDENVTYDEVKGYLTDVASVKHGLIGTWEDPDGAAWGYTYEITFNGRTVNAIEKEEGYEDDEWSASYSVSSKNDKFYLKLTIGNISAESEILILNETTLSYYNEEYDYTETFTRKQ